MLTWLLQDGGVSERATNAVASAVRRSGHSVAMVRVVPFCHEAASPLPLIDGTCVTYGSTGLLQLAKAIGLTPAGWDGPAFSMSSLSDAIAELTLNDNSVFCAHSEAAVRATELGWDWVFVKPDSEAKEFAGATVEVSILRKRIEAMRRVGYFDLQDNRVLIAPIVGIEEEWRAFVVDGTIVASSSYLKSTTPQAPDDVLRFIERVIARYTPAPVFVLDVALRSNGQLRVVETNSVNSSGFYACSVPSVVEAVSDYVMRCSK